MRKPIVKTKCVANGYAAPNERIVEVTSDTYGTGCLIRFVKTDAGLEIQVYRAGNKVIVHPAQFDE